MSAGTHGASDILTLGADWEAQDTAKATTRDRITAPKANGDIAASTTFGDSIEIVVPYIYIGAETLLAAALEAASANVGQLLATYLITAIDCDLSPLGDGKRAMINFTAVNGFSAASAIYKPSIEVLLTVGSIPDLLTNSDADSECTGAKYGISAPHGSDRAADGDIIRGATYGGEETLELDYYGIPTLTSTGWDDPSESERDSNSEYSGSSYSFVKGVDRYVAL